MLALLLASVPVNLSATSAEADSNSDVHVIWIDSAFAPNIIVDNTVVAHQIPTATAVDITLGVGLHTIVACDNVATQFDGVNCLDAGNNIVAGPFGFTGIDNVNIGSGHASYTVVLNAFGAPGSYMFRNNEDTTGFNRARFQLNNASLGDVSVCIDSHDGNGITPVVSNIPATTPPTTSSQDSNEITAVQSAQVYIGDPVDPCSTYQNFTLNLPAGTNTVLTATNSGPDTGTNPSCGDACIQVLYVGEDTHPSTPDIEVFCGDIAAAVRVQAGLKDLVGNVDPTDETTIADTQPSVGAMQTFVESTNAILVAGDESVPPIAAASWATATADLRKLLRTFEVVGYDLSKLPPAAVEQIVLGANGIQLPGVPPNKDVVGATEALTAFYANNCGVDPAPTPAPVVPPVNQTPKFTG